MTVASATQSSAAADPSRAYSLVAIPPESFGKYTLIGKLGHGGMAEVNLAVSEGKGGFRKLVVLKRLHRHLAMEPGFVDMFLDEARLAARLNHPHCVQTNEVGEHSDTHFLAMEYLDGQGLERLLRISGSQDVDVPPDLAARIVSDALDGLAYAHELTDFDGTPLHVVHRDVSPQNIFITYNGMVKLLDFGIAKAATHVVETKTGVIKGKYAYIAPEQALGQDVDQRSDLWSMGVVLWEVLTGRRLFKSVNELATLHETLQGNIKLPSAYRPDLPTELDTICMRALSRDPADRYASAQQMKDDLDRYLLSLPSPPGRKQIARLMRERFASVISQHKKTLAECLEGTVKISHSSIERLVGESMGSASGIRVSESGATPTPTPAFGPTVTPPPMSSGELTPSPGASEEERRGGLIIRALAVVLVLLLAVIAALLVPLGDDDEHAPGTRVVSGDPPPEPEAAIGGHVQLEPQAIGLGDPVAPASDAVENAEPEGAADPGEDEGGEDEGGEDGPDEAAPAETEEAEPGGDEAAEPRATGSAAERAAARRRAERRARAARERAAQAAAEVTEAPPPPEPERPAPEAQVGRLTLATTPWTHVYLGGRDLGTTPLINVELPAGTHRLRLVNREQGIDEPYSVTIQAGQRLTRRLGLR